ncbi:MAG: Ig-like domain-containing protein, partial [Verrucomicrobiota bacterium]
MNHHPLSRFPDPLRLTLVFASMAAAATGAVPLIGNLTITQNDTGNTEASVSGTITQGNGATYHAGSRGDFGLRFDGATPAADVANGVLIATISENGRSNEGATPTAIGAGLAFATPAIQLGGNLGAGNTSFPGYSTSINVSNSAVAGVASGSEWNANQSFAYFKTTEWLGGWVTNGTHAATGGTNNGAMTAFASATPGFTVASGATDPGTATVFDSTANAGFYTVHLDGFTAPRGTNPPVAANSQSGILLVTGGKNEDNYAQASANANGTFTLICKDNGSDAFNFENDPVAFVYIPAGHTDVAAMGRVDAEGDVSVGSGSFTVTKGGTGQWYVSAPGLTGNNSVFLMSPEGATVSGTNRADNIWSFAWDNANNRWVVEGRDVSTTETATPGLQNLTADEPAFSFAIFTTEDFNRPPTVSLDSPVDGSVLISGASVTLTATASDDSAVSKVEFYDGTTLLGQDTTVPYELVLENPVIGTHSYTAKATDDGAAVSSSGSSTVTITPAPGTDGLYFDGVNDHVTFGDNPALKLSTFTLECWFKREAG